jgi:hypothetical protein
MKVREVGQMDGVLYSFGRIGVMRRTQTRPMYQTGPDHNIRQIRKA